MKAHTSQRPQPLRSLPNCEQISSQLEAVVLKCLQKSPSDRFASMADLNQAIDEAIAASPVDLASTTSNTIVQPRPSTAGSDTPTVAQSPLPAVGSDNSTVARQITPAAESAINEPVTIPQIPVAAESIGQPNCDDGEISDQTIYQEVASPASTQADQTRFQPRSPNQNQADQTRFQPRSPNQNQLDQTRFQPRSPKPDEKDRTSYQRLSLFTRLRRMSRQFERVNFQSIISLIPQIGRSLRKIESWIRSRRFRL